MNSLIENFQDEFSKIFIVVNFKETYDKLISVLYFYYETTTEVFITYEDQIKELEMLRSDENSDANVTVDLMIKNLYIEKDKENMNNQNMMQENLQEIIEESFTESLKENEYIEKVKEKFFGNMTELIMMSLK